MLNICDGDKAAARMALEKVKACQVFTFFEDLYARAFLERMNTEFAYFRNQVIVAARRNMPLVDNGIPAEFSSCIGAEDARLPTPYQLRFHDRHLREPRSRRPRLGTAVLR